MEIFSVLPPVCLTQLFHKNDLVGKYGFGSFVGKAECLHDLHGGLDRACSLLPNAYHSLSPPAKLKSLPLPAAW